MPRHLMSKPTRDEPRVTTSLKVRPSLWRLAKGTAHLKGQNLEEFVEDALRTAILAVAHDTAVMERVREITGTTGEE